jgi:hypothetical protein
MAWLAEADFVAVYAAIVATIVLIWDVVKWYKEGPKLVVTVSALAAPVLS